MSSIGDADLRSQAYSRKDKSLGLLCVNFLKHYTKEQVDCISLDEAACRLGVERRRIYDIVNVLESVGVLIRRAKNTYTWKGFDGIPRALEKLRESGLKEEAIRSWRQFPEESDGKHSKEQLQALITSDEEDENSSNENCCSSEPVGTDGKCGSTKCSPVSVLTESSKTSPVKSKQDCRREKSLGLLTQKFVQLFLVTEAEIVSLEEAARILLGECKEPAKLKTKVRRLYDIANILSSLNLIEKTHNAINRKPAFKWLGVKGKADLSFTGTESRKRKFGTEISLNTGEPCVRKRGRPSTKQATASPSRQSQQRHKSGHADQKPYKAEESLYNPIPVYPTEGSLSSIPVAEPARRVLTGLTLGTTSRSGWREWATVNSRTHSDSVLSPKTGGKGRDRQSSFNSQSSFIFGPFCPFRLQQQCLEGISSQNSEHANTKKDRECASQDSKPMNPFTHCYHNQGLDEMLMHYANAWRSWYLHAVVPAKASGSLPTQSCDSVSDG